MAGGRIAAEAAHRGHQVSGFSRSEGEGGGPAGVALSTADASDPRAMTRIAGDHDVVVLATRPSSGREADVGTVATAVLDAALGAGRRVLVIGGAGPLHSPGNPDRLVVDDQRFVPLQWRDIAQSSVDQLAACDGHRADWTYVSPPALFGPGIRTGAYRRGGTELLVDEHGISRISAEDFALAAVDELEGPQPDVRHFTVAY